MKSSGCPISQSQFSRSSTTLSVAEISAAFIAAALFGAIVSWRSGQDVNWDWQNYHDYAVWSLFGNRLWIDVAPAALQTYLNPLPLVPDYLARNFLPTPTGAVVMGAIQGTALALTWIIAVRLVGRVIALTSVVTAASGPLMLSEIGTSFPDVITAIPILAGLYLLIFAERDDRKSLIWSGFLIGLAVGAKLSNGPFLIAALLASMVGDGRKARCAHLLFGSAIGGLLAAGPWAILMWREFGNPIFPLYNGFFHAPEGAPTNFADRRFIPVSFADWLAYPFRWLVGQHPSSEVPFRDARFAVLALLAPFAIGVRLGRNAPLFTVPDVRLLVFVVAAYVLWSGMFSIHRYIVALEMLAGPVIGLILSRALTTYTAVAVSAVFAAAIALWSVPANWGHRPWNDAYILKVPDQVAKSPSIFVMLDAPLAYVARHLPQGSRFFSIASGSSLPLPQGGKHDTRIRGALDNASPDTLWAIRIRNVPYHQAALSRYGLELSRSKSCIPAAGAQVPLEFCPLDRKGGSARNRGEQGG